MAPKPNGTVVTLTGSTSGDFSQIEAWVSTSLIVGGKLHGTLGVVNVRLRPDVEDDSCIIKAMPNGTAVETTGTTNGLFSQIKAWAKTLLLLVAPARVRLGVNCLDDIGAAQTALARGCLFLTVMGYPDLTHAQDAIDLANQYPLAQILYRVYWGNTVPTPDQYLAAIGKGHPGILYLPGWNEGDSLGQDLADIPGRAAKDGEMFHAFQAKGLRYAGGGFSMGTPDFTDPAVVAAMKAGYAGLYNAGMYFSMHLYGPDLNGMDQWYETRYEFLTECGFDASRRQVISDECGLDEDGGFVSHQVSQDQFRAWTDDFFHNHSQPPNILLGGCIFQYGGHPDWQAYNVAVYLDVLTDVWNREASSVPASIPARDVDTVGRYGQRDSRWFDRRLGFGTLKSQTIGNYGCLLTCIAGLGRKDPGVMNEVMKAAHLFTGDEVNNRDISAVAPYRLGLDEFYGNLVPAADMTRLKSHLRDSGFPAILLVDIDPDPDLDTHFLIGTGWNDARGLPIVWDPWYAQEVVVTEHYGARTHTAEEAIWAIRLYSPTGRTT